MSFQKCSCYCGELLLTKFVFNNFPLKYELFHATEFTNNNNNNNKLEYYYRFLTDKTILAQTEQYGLVGQQLPQ